MSLLLTSALLASTALTVPTCSWDRPGVDPFTGSLVESVDRYTDIPADVRATLKERMQRRAYDDLVTIRRDAIAGRDTYAPEIRDMHFGAGRICRSVTRAQWAMHHEERGLVYCASGHCLLVPTVCRNLSRITRLPPPAAAAAGPAGVTGRAASMSVPAENAGGSVATPEPAAPAASFAETASGGPAPTVAAPLATASNDPPSIVVPAVPISFAPSAGTPAYPAGAAVPLADPGPIPNDGPGVSVLPPATVSPVPETPAALLWLLGLSGMAAFRARNAARTRGSMGSAAAKPDDHPGLSELGL